MKKLRQQWRWLLVAVLVLFIGAYIFAIHLKTLYQEQLSGAVTDRSGEVLGVLPNAKGHYVRPLPAVPDLFRELLLQKEDRYFYCHPGVNPLSILRDMVQFPRTLKFKGSSTLTQQLVKNLLHQENQRTLGNKIVEGLGALSLELFTSKSDILKMYANTAYFGNLAAGLGEASNYYFGLPPEALSRQQIAELLTALSNPGYLAPGSAANQKLTAARAALYGLTATSSDPLPGNREPRRDAAMFELAGLDLPCESGCQTTIDQNLTASIRNLMQRDLDLPAFAEVKNGAVVVLKLGPQENELLALVGSPHPDTAENGWQINMATAPRPVGSTAKPFIYGRAFEKGARPYTFVDDLEYRYTIGTGFSFYPKNYDGQYRGRVTLHQALDNSLNVPSVKVLEWVGLPDFNDFLVNRLGFLPRQDMETYELGIALGGLEMDPLTLTNYFSALPSGGVLKPLRVVENSADYLTPPMMAKAKSSRTVLAEPATELINKILSDRATGVDQFGLKSNLNLTQSNYAVKTGTTYDYHSSWTVGYTPDFVVGVWLGNSDNSAPKQLAGVSGAGRLWHDVMELLFATEYNHRTAFTFDHLQTYPTGQGLDYGLPGDDFEKAEVLLVNHSPVLSPHDGDTFEYEPNMTIPLKSQGQCHWSVNDADLGSGAEVDWQPQKAGVYIIRASCPNTPETKLSLTITQPT